MEFLHRSVYTRESWTIVVTPLLLDASMDTSTVPSIPLMVNRTAINVTTVPGPQGEFKFTSNLL